MEKSGTLSGCRDAFPQRPFYRRGCDHIESPGRGDSILSRVCSKAEPLHTLLLLTLLLAGFVIAIPLAGQEGRTSPYNAPGDTLTVIQLPLLNIPVIVIPGETFTITCIAPPTTTNWTATLLRGNQIHPLQLLSYQYVNSPDRWLLQAQVPYLPVYELYNLRVTASGGIDDLSRNAVQVIPTRKTSYYFAHITDLHMPTRIYWPDDGFDTDSLAVNDFRAVMDDLNLIRPEFVLITGDLINEGELEGFAGQYWYAWIKRILYEMQVPIYVVSGNHDIGGWNSTPAPQGSARRHWWKYFGWQWNYNPSLTWTQHTQDYSFTYNNVHFIGMEGYINYDNWWSMIFGGQSFTNNQMIWLNNTLTLYPHHTKVLFYHYDFSDQISLSSLGFAMGLWGHTHTNSGSITQTPYNLSTRSVCNGNRAYRIIRVNSQQLQPSNTIYAGTAGSNININFYPSNTGIADSVRAVVVNNQSISFEHSLVRFKMPAGSYTYTVTNGVLEQVDTSGSFNVCYVRVNLTSNSTVFVSIKANPVGLDDHSAVPAAFSIRSHYPNPFRENSTIVLNNDHKTLLRVTVHNLRGQIVRTIHDGLSPAGEVIFNWDGKDDDRRSLPPGIYLIRIQGQNHSRTVKTVKL